MTLYELQKKLNNYYNLKAIIRYDINKLNNAIDSLDLVIKNFSVSYSVDDSSIGKDTSIDQKNKLIARRDLLQNQVAPAINMQITKIKKQIEEEQQNII